MKNEEIIIDGIDVSKCKYYLYRDKKSKGERCCGVGLTDCNGQMCLYKQLKLQEQENVRLREKFNNLISTPIYENCNLLLEQKRRLEKCLQEIKEIAETAKRDLCNNCGWGYTESCDPEDYTCGEFIKILQKITKAEEE